MTIRGRIEEYDERAEIILRHAQQLGEGAALLTAIPKEYDVEKQAVAGSTGVASNTLCF